MPAAPRRAGRNVASPSGKVPAPPRAERSACPRPHRNLRRQRQFDAERVAGTVHRNDEGLRAGLAEEVPGMEAVVRKHPLVSPVATSGPTDPRSSPAVNSRPWP